MKANIQYIPSYTDFLKGQSSSYVLNNVGLICAVRKLADKYDLPYMNVTKHIHIWISFWNATHLVDVGFDAKSKKCSMNVFLNKISKFSERYDGLVKGANFLQRDNVNFNDLEDILKVYFGPFSH